MYLRKMLLLFLLMGMSTLPLNSQSIDNEDGIGGELSISERMSQLENMRIQKVSDLLSQNNISQIDTLFNSDEDDYFTLLRQNDKENASFVREMMFKAYRNVPNLQDNLLFIDCKKAALSEDWDLVALKTNDLIRRFPDSDRKDSAVNYWKFALIKAGKDQEYIALVEQYPELDKPIQKFHYGQSLYNVGRYDEAQPYLIEAASYPKYAFRATATLALLSFAKGNFEESTQILDHLEANYPPETPYYEFVILSKARVFSYFNDTKGANLYYKTYRDLQGTAVEDEVIYEIAMSHRNAGELNKAKRAFEILLSSNNGDKYYIPTLYNLVILDIEMNEGENSENLLTGYQNRVDEYFNDLVANRNLMNEVRSLRNRYIMENEKSSQDILLEEIRAKEKLIMTNQDSLAKKISYLDSNTVELIKNIELGLLERTETYFLELGEIEKFRNSPKDQLIATINQDRSSTEASYVLSITEELLKDIPNPNNDQFMRAYIYANQIYIKKKFIVNVSNLITKTKNLPEKNRELKEQLRVENENLDELNVKAIYELAEFPNLESKQKNIDEMVDEFVLSEQKMEVKRKKVIDSYYDIVANKRKNNVKEDFQELDKSINIYANSFNKFENIKKEQHKNIDFIALDLEYRKLMKRYKEDYGKEAEDTLSADVTYDQIVSEAEIVFQDMNRFVFQNNDFENNYKLYFNMAELSNLIYSKNVKIIYDLYSKVIELNPDFPQKDVVYYNMAVNNQQIIDNQIGVEREKLIKSGNYFSTNARPQNVVKNPTRYKEVLDNYIKVIKDGESEYQINAMFRMAQLLFSFAVDGDNPTYYIEKALKTYEEIYELGERDDVMQALFFSAWNKIVIGKHIEAIEDLSLLMLMKDEFNDSQKIRFKSGEDIIAYALDRLSLEESEVYVKNELFNKFDTETAENSFNNLVAKKDLASNYNAVVNLYNARSLVDPNAIQNPTYVDSIITTIGRYHFVIGADSLQNWGDQIYKEAYERFGYNSEWYENNKDNDIAPYIGSIQTALEDHVIPERYLTMRDNPTLDTIQPFSSIVDEYANYRGLDDSKRAAKLKDYDKNAINNFTNYVIANPDTTTWRAGINNVYGYIERNPDVENRATLEESAYSWAHNITTVVDTTYYDSTKFTQAEIDVIIESAREEYLEIADRFYSYLVSSDIPEKDETLHKLFYWRGRRKMDMGDKDGARNDFLASDSLNISDKFKKDIYSSLAQIHRDEGDFDTANDYFARAQNYADNEDKEEFNKAIYETKRSKFTALKDSGKPAEAAIVLEDLNQSKFTSNEMKSQNKIEVIALLNEGEDYQAAIDRLINEAESVADVNSAWNYYSQAIPLARVSLQDDAQAEGIKDMFMQRFPNDLQTFVILKERLDAVKDPALPTYDALLASQKYIEIYDRSTQTGEKLDISGDNLTPVEYYALGIDIKCTELTKAEQVEEWIAFREKFPDFNTVNVLDRICGLYEDLEMNEKYLEYIIILYGVDNTTGRYPTYAAEKLIEKNKEISLAYRNEDWQVMLDRISEFEVLSDTFTENGIPPVELTIPTLKELYAGYILDYERDEEKKAFLAEINTNIENYLSFTDVDPDDITRLRVNANTTWYGYLVTGQNRFQTLDEKAQEQFRLIEQDILRVSEFNLTSQEAFAQIYRLYFAEYKISDYIADAYLNQYNKFLGYENNDKGTTRYEESLWDDLNLSVEQIETRLEQYYEELRTVPYTYIGNYVDKSALTLRSVYEAFINGVTDPPENYEVVLAGLNKYDLNEGDPVTEIPVDFVPQMRKDFSNIIETAYNDNYRDYTMYNIPAGESLLIETDIECPIFPKQYRFRFLSESNFTSNNSIDFQVLINEEVIDLKTGLLYDGEIDDSLSVYPYLLRQVGNINNIATNNLSVGDNKLAISVTNNDLTTLNLGMLFSIIYDQEELYIFENQIIHKIVSDNSWIATDSLQTLDLNDPSWKQVNYGSMIDDYYQLDIFKESNAMPIWLNVPEIIDDTILSTIDIDTTVVVISNGDTLDVAFQQADSTLTDSSIEEVEEVVTYGTTYFAKEFEVEGNVIDFTTYYLLNESAKVFLNGEEITELWPFYDPPYTDNFIIEDKLVQGKNTIIFAVNGPLEKNGLIVEMRIKTLEERR